MVSKGGCDKIKLELIVGMGYFYMIIKNKCIKLEKMEIMKFDFVVCKYVVYKEIKIK